MYERGYGDCKALTNYMLSLLKAVNIDAYPALIHNARLPNGFLNDFPSNQFNHVILCVPTSDDTVWLECTSQTIPFGHIGASNENRYALVVGPQGGTLVRTPSSKAADNCQIRKATVTLQINGDASATIHTLYTGNQQDYVRTGLKVASPRERDDWLKEYIDIPAFNLVKTDFSQLDKKDMRVELTMQVQLPRYAAVAGNRLLLQHNLMERRSYVPQPLKNRKYPIMHSYAYLDIDSILYTLPQNYVVEVLPKAVTIQTPFAEYQSSINSDEDGSLLYTRHLEVSETVLPPESYDQYRTFLQEIAEADKAISALVRRQ